MNPGTLPTTAFTRHAQSSSKFCWGPMLQCTLYYCSSAPHKIVSFIP